VADLVTENPGRKCSTNGCHRTVSSDRRSDLNPTGRGTKYYNPDGLCQHHRNPERQARLHEERRAQKRKADEADKKGEELLKHCRAKAEEFKAKRVRAEDRLDEVRELVKQSVAGDQAAIEAYDEAEREANRLLDL
jgi:hypothetical protein